MPIFKTIMRKVEISNVYGMIENVSDGIVTPAVNGKNMDFNDNNLNLVYLGLMAIAHIQPSIPKMLSCEYISDVRMSELELCNILCITREVRHNNYTSYSEALMRMSYREMITCMWQIIYTLVDAYHRAGYRTDFSATGIDRILIYDLGKDTIFKINYTFGICQTCYRYLPYVRPLPNDGIILESLDGSDELIVKSDINIIYTYLKSLMITVKTMIENQDMFEYYNYIRALIMTIWPELIDKIAPNTLPETYSSGKYIHVLLSNMNEYARLNIPWMSLNVHMKHTKNVVIDSLYSYICYDPSKSFVQIAGDYNNTRDIYAIRPRDTEIEPLSIPALMSDVAFWRDKH